MNITIINEKLNQTKKIYSLIFSDILEAMLEIDPNKRLDFIQLEFTYLK